MDPDDEMLPTLLRDNVLIMGKYNTDLVLFRYCEKRLDEGQFLGDNRQFCERYKYLTSYCFKSHFIDIFKQYNLYSPVNKIYSLEIINNMGLRFNAQSVGEDAIFNIDYFKYVDSMVINSNIYYVYWKREGSLMHNFSERRMKETFQVYKHLKKMLHEFGLDESFADSDIISFVYNMRNKVNKSIFRKMYRYVLKNCRKNIKDVIKLILITPNLL